jgi:hypothetical protein
MRPLVSLIHGPEMVAQAEVQGTLELPLQAWKKCIQIVSGAKHWAMNALFVRMQSSIRSTGLSWSRRKLEKICRLPTGAWYEAIQATISVRIKKGHQKRRKMLRKVRATKLHKLCSVTGWLATDRSAETSHRDLEKQQLEEWEVLDHELPGLDDSLRCSTRSVGGLVCEIFQLIDSCEGLGFAGWDEMIAILEGRISHKTGQGGYSEVCSELVRSERAVAHDDWELVY